MYRMSISNKDRTASRVLSFGALSRRHFSLALFSLMLGCSGGSSNTNDADSNAEPTTESPSLTDDVSVEIAVNDSSAAGSVDWNLVGDDNLTVTVAIPEDTSLSLLLNAESPTDVFRMSSFPESGAAALSDGVLEYTPDLNFFGADALRIVRNSTEYRFALIVTPVNDAPVIVGDIDRVAEQGVMYASQLRVRNVDRDQLQFSSSNLPSWLSLDPQTGELIGTPSQRHVGLHENINLIVRDDGGLDDVLSGVTIEVLDLNDAPTLNISQFPDNLDAREQIRVNIFPDDLDGDSVSLVVEQNDFVTTEVDGGWVTVTANDVIEVTNINMVLDATDQLGNVTREIVPFTLFPKTESGIGRTLQGRKMGAGIHLVVLGDGYREDQLSQFRGDVQNLITVMSEDPAVDLHLSAWNIHMIETASVDSGIDDNVSEDLRDTVFNAGYFCLSIPRLICGDNNAMFNIALDEYADLDELVLLVNDPRYGGSGGSVAIASSSAPEIALHEMGHSLAGLADEYVDNAIPSITIAEFDEGGFPNVSSLQDPTLVPWHVWIDTENTIPSQDGDEGVGIFQGGYYDADAFYRPTFNSRMRAFDRPFGPVNGEAWALSVYRETNPVSAFSPRTEEVFVAAGDTMAFSVQPIFGPEIQRVVWTLDGQLLAESINENELEVLLSTGEHILTLSVNDLTGAIRQPGPHPGQFLWRWDITVQ